MYPKLSAKTLTSEVCIWFDVQHNDITTPQATGSQNMTHQKLIPISAPFWSVNSLKNVFASALSSP